MGNSSLASQGLLFRPVRRGTELAGSGFLVLMALCACSPDTAPVAGQAREFHQLLESAKLQEACALLHAKALEPATEQRGGCEDTLESLELPQAGPVLEAHVYGRNASVVFEGDTVFLAATDSGWRVTGAGCTSGEEAPYTCEIGGE